MRTRCATPVWAALAFAVAIGGCGRGDSTPPPDAPRPPRADGAFGVFAAFAPEFAPFWTSIGLDYAGYQDWAGGRLDDLGDSVRAYAQREVASDDPALLAYAALAAWLAPPALRSLELPSLSMAPSPEIGTTAGGISQ